MNTTPALCSFCAQPGDLRTVDVTFPRSHFGPPIKIADRRICERCVAAAEANRWKLYFVPPKAVAVDEELPE